MSAKSSFLSTLNKGYSLAAVLLFITAISFSNLGPFSLLNELKIEKLEKLAECEKDVDIEEKEKSQESEEDSFLYAFSKNIFESDDGLRHDQFTLKQTSYHLKIPTPPPDLV